MTVTYHGLDCIADKGDEQYASLKKISQSGKNAWAYQTNYGFYTVYFGLVLIFCMVLKNLYFRYNDYAYRNEKLGYKGSFFHPRLLTKLIALTRSVAYSRLPMMISRITGLPSSIGTLILFASSTLFILCYCFIPHPWIRECKGFGSPPLSVRAGLMCMALTPFLYLMSGKTNFISWVTGVSYEKLNIFHQALGWGSLFLGLVHTVPFFTQPVAEGGYSNLNKFIRTDELYYNGIAALIPLILICLLSTRLSRKLSYEVFFHSHWVLGLIYFALLTWHVYGELKADQYMWATLGFWCFQMVYRALVKTTFKPNAYSFKSKTATIKPLGISGTFEVLIPIEGGIDELIWEPGQHVFIRFVYGMATLDNHPFSIVSIPKTGDSCGKTNIKLIVKPKSGLTRKLNDLISQEHDDSKKLQVFLDGPYGGMNRDVLSFDQVVLLSTGSGVSVTWPFVEHVIENSDNPSSRVQNLKFLWVVKTVDYIEVISNEIVESMNKIAEIYGSFDRFEFGVFVTNSEEVAPKVVTDVNSDHSTGSNPNSGYVESNLVTSEEENIEKHSITLITRQNFMEHLMVHMSARPKINTYLNSIRLSAGRNCFVVSGSSSFQADVGNGVSQLQAQVLRANDVEEVYLHSESFGW